jgi:hypothetical protein
MKKICLLCGEDRLIGVLSTGVRNDNLTASRRAHWIVLSSTGRAVE